MEEGLRAPGIAAVVGEVGALPAVASAPTAVAAERSGITAFLLRRWRDGGRAARERALPNAAVTRWPDRPRCRRGPRKENPGVGRPWWQVELLRVPRRRAGMLGRWREPMRRVSISGCSTGRSTGGTCLGRKIPARRLTRSHSPRLSMPPDGGFSPPINPAAAAAGLAPGMSLADALSFPRPRHCRGSSPQRTPRHSADWRNGAAVTARGRHPMVPMGCASRSPAQPIFGAGEAALAADLIARLDRRWHCRTHCDCRHARRRLGDGPFCRNRATARSSCRRAIAAPPSRRCRWKPSVSTRRSPKVCARVGLKRIGDLYAMPRDALAQPFRRDAGAASRSGARQYAGAVVAIGRGPDPAGAA